MIRSKRHIKTILIMTLAGISGPGWSLPDRDDDWFGGAADLNAERIVFPNPVESVPLPSEDVRKPLSPMEGSVARLLDLSSLPVADLLATESKEKKSTRPEDMVVLPNIKPQASVDDLPSVSPLRKNQKSLPAAIEVRTFPDRLPLVEHDKQRYEVEQRELKELVAKLEPDLLGEKWHVARSEDTAKRAASSPKVDWPAETGPAQTVPKSSQLASGLDSDCGINTCIRLFQDQQLKHWLVEPQRLDITLMHEQVQVSIQGKEAPLLFVRDQGILHWDAEQRQLHVKAAGETELYIVDNQKMLIVPVRVAAGSQQAKEPRKKTQRPDLVADQQSLLSLKPLSGLSYGPQKSMTRQGSKTQQPSRSQSVQVNTFGPDGKPVRAPSIAVQPNYGLLGLESERKTLTLQLIDERSVVAEGKLYPVKDARVRVLGTNWQGLTDVRGVLNIPDVPEGSRLIFQVDHPGGQIPLHSYEVFVNYEPGVQQERFTVMTYRSFFLYSQIFQVAQRTDLSSVCLALHSLDGAKALTGIQVALNGEADGPFYFNQFGPNPLGVETDRSGRFCLFNVDPGLTEISFYRDDIYLSSVAVPLLEGSHLDDEVFIGNGSAFELRLAAMPTALEQLYSDFDRYMTFHAVDFVNMIAVGINDELSSKQSGVVEGQAGYSWYRGKMYILAQAPEFESVLLGVNDQAFDTTRGRLMAPMLPRGFVEDLFQELYLAESSLVEAFDSALGTVLVLFGQSEEEQKQHQGPVKVRLINQFGTQVKEGWYFGSGADGLSKAIFFNLQPGIYSVIVESRDGVWLDFETVAVDFWTTSLVQTGHVLGEIDP